MLRFFLEKVQPSFMGASESRIVECGEYGEPGSATVYQFCRIRSKVLKKRQKPSSQCLHSVYWQAYGPLLLAGGLTLGEQGASTFRAEALDDLQLLLLA